VTVRAKVLLPVALCALLALRPIADAQEAAPEPPKSPAKKSSKIHPPTMEELKQTGKKVGRHAKRAVVKTAETAAKEVKEVAHEAEHVARHAHSFGGRVLQGIINVMIAASPGKTRVYLPAPSSDPNSGVTVGVLPVFLFVDDKEVVRHILAPSLTYNQIFKMTTTMRYYWYPRKGAQLFALGSYALETNRRLAFRYEDPEFFAHWFNFKFDYNWAHDGSYRFFGMGPQSPAGNQTNYTLRDQHLQVHTGLNFWDEYRLIFTQRLRAANVVNGAIDSLPQITGFAPRPIGVEDRRTIFAQRATLQYDSRDLAVAPVRGHFFSLFFEGAGHAGGDTRYERMGTDLRGYYPLRNNRFVTGWRFEMEGENGEDVPFYEQSLLGGKDSLRGYGDARFVDRNRLSYTLEERIRFYRLNAFNVNVDFEVTPFYEAGTVAGRLSDFKSEKLHHVAGVGFRSVVRPSVVGVVDIGFGDEGLALFVGIDYPF
jgi:hypothetical protein